MTEPGKEYYTAFTQLQTALTPIKKSKSGHNWTYASIDDIWHVVLPLLDRYGFVIKSARTLINGQMFLKTCLVHIQSLQGIEDLSPLMAYTTASYDDQEVGENVTYQRRYALMILFNLQMEEDTVEKRARMNPKHTENIRSVPDSISLKTIDPQQALTLKTLLNELPNGSLLEKNIVSFNKVSSLDHLTENQYSRALTYIKEQHSK